MNWLRRSFYYTYFFNHLIQYKGILKIDLTHEYIKIAEAFNLSLRNMFDLSRSSIRNIFDKSEKTQKSLEKVFEEYEKENF
jgi:hypothetical protein